MTRDELIERMARAAEALHGSIGPSASCDYDQIMRAALAELEKHAVVTIFGEMDRLLPRTR